MPEMPVPPAIAKIAPDGNLSRRQMRQVLLEMSLRKQRPGTGSSPESNLRRTALNLWPDLREVFKGIDWVLIGGVATRAYMPERMTKDMDVLVREKDADEAIARLQRAGYRLISRLAIPGYLLRSPDGVEVDLVVGQYPWLDEAFETQRLDPAGYPVIDLPFLVVLKLAAQPLQDMADISRMLGWADEETLTRVRAAVAKYSPEDSGDLETLIFLGRKERESRPLDPEA